MDKKLDEINEKLSKMLTKDDKVFIKEIIKTTIEEMKERILQSVTLRIEHLECEMHQVGVESNKYKVQLNEKDKEIEQLKEKNTQLLSQLKAEESVREKEINELEQYGRRNNVRISGILGDSDKQQSAETARLFIIRHFKEKSLELDVKDIDIAHRLGKWEDGKNRPVIVKFVRRQTKIEMMQSAKELRKNGLFVSEDLTWLNQKVLASLMLKERDQVKKCWSFEGKLFAVFTDGTKPVEIKHKDYNTWLSKPWPEKRNQQSKYGR